MHRIHMVTPFHSVPSLERSHCAFSGKALRFGKMMRGRAEVIEYANEGSESEAVEHVVLLTRAECEEHFPKGPAEFEAKHAATGTPGWSLFGERLRAELAKRIGPRDVIGHVFGDAFRHLTLFFPKHAHLETGVGYTAAPFGAYRVFESETWRAYHWGRYGATHGEGLVVNGKPIEADPGMNRPYSWVIPNYFDANEWPAGDGAGGYVLFLARLADDKGAALFVELAGLWRRRHPASKLRWILAGQGEWAPFAAKIDPAARPFVHYAGVVTGTKRAALVGSALAMMAPTQYVEPFGGAGVEGMLTGTPLVASDWGAYVETIEHGRTGFRCKTIPDWLDAIEAIGRGQLSRGYVRDRALERFSLEACAPLYEQAIEALVGERVGIFGGEGFYGDPKMPAPDRRARRAARARKAV